MPQFTITAPDGTKYNVTAPAGASEQEVLQRVQAQWQQERKTAPASKLGFTTKDLEGSPMLGALAGAQAEAGAWLGLGDIARGALKTGGGVAQTATDIGSLIGIPGAETASKAIPGLVEKAGSALPSVGGLAGTMLEGMGEAAPYMAMGGGGLVRGALTGAIAGATQLTKGSTEERLLERGGGAVAGGLGGALLSGAGSLVGRLASSKALESTIKGMRNYYKDIDPALTQQRGTLNQTVDRLTGRWKEMSDAALAQGDKTPIDLADVQDKIRDLAGKSDVSVVKKAAKTLTPSPSLPDKLTVGGRDFARDGADYVNKQTGEILNPKIREAALSNQGVKKDNAASYSQVKRSIEEIDDYLDNTKNPDGLAARDARAMRDILQGKLDDSIDTSTRVLQDKADKFHERNLAKFDSPAVKGILTETDPLERANKALAVALGSNAKDAETVAGLVGKKGRDAIQQGALKRGLEAAYSEKEGTIDPVKFVHFFEDKKGLNAFKDAHFDDHIEGIRSLMRESALLKGEADTPHLTKPYGHLGGWYAGVELLRGRVREAAIIGTASVAVGPTFQFFNRMLNDSFGRHLLIAASKVPPGSNRSTRLLQQALQKFGPAAAGVAAGGAAGSP